jgi:hypothetical protein
LNCTQDKGLYPVATDGDFLLYLPRRPAGRSFLFSFFHLPIMAYFSASIYLTTTEYEFISEETFEGAAG